MKIAIAQTNPTIGELAGNACQILQFAQQAQQQNVSLLLTSELSLCGYPPKDLLLNASFINDMAATLEQLARDLPQNMAVLIGCVQINHNFHQSGGKPLFNSAALLHQGKVEQVFHKRLLPNYDVFDEHRYFEPGLQTNCFSFSSIKIGVSICEDFWNDEDFWGKRSYATNPIADLAALNVDLIVNLSASPYSAAKPHLREAMLRHAAIRYQKPIIYANQVGANDDLIFDGCSVGFNCKGEVICRASAFETDLVVVEFDEKLPELQPRAITQGVASQVIAPMPENDDEEIWKALVLGVRDYSRKCGFSKVVIGLSGGVDSALVTQIAASALGKENVLVILMPSPYSSDHSVKDALLLAKNLGIATQTLPIGDLMQGYDKTLAPLFADTPFGLAEENIQSRIRGNLLMAIANKFGYLLLSTGNKSEMAVGYCTLYGDMNGGLAAIADVPKTRVYSICNWLNRTTEIIPKNILTKPPSAELKPGQVDADSLPPYDILDDILQRSIHNYQSAAQIVAAGHDKATVTRILALVARSEFKRRQAPPGLKITDRAFGTGWRMPIANKWIDASTNQPKLLLANS
ncbi:MAG: NAD+ synthase [Chroococcus sp. CMT-3BRIN-NPC107]|jgi:NAD+ synthetase|nr:NAD+ synthase [Chroococcus sp. CMT-3BRIN-NPC107]